MTRLNIYVSVVLCLIIVVGCSAGTKQSVGTKQKAGADNGPYGKYVLSVDPIQYFELRPDGRCLYGARELTPDGYFRGSIEVFSATCEVKGDIVTFIDLNKRKVELKLQGNTLVPPKFERGTPRMQKAMEGAKFIKR
jgi:hypothetical protein